MYKIKSAVDLNDKRPPTVDELKCFKSLNLSTDQSTTLRILAHGHRIADKF